MCFSECTSVKEIKSKKEKKNENKERQAKEDLKWKLFV